MLTKKIFYAVLSTITTFGLLACGDSTDNTEAPQLPFSLTDTIDPEDCSESTEGSMAFVKAKSTMYVCSDGEWIAMNDQEAIQYRCTSSELEDKSGFAIICDGSDTIGVIYNGKDGTNGKDVDVDKIQKDIDARLSSASAQNQSEMDEALKNLSSASAKNQKNVDDALKNLSSASAKNEKDLNDKLSSTSREIDEKFDDAYSSWTAELENKKCEIVNTERNDETAIITVTIKCGKAETKMEIPFTVPNENLEKKFTKHVVVRLPVMSEKKTDSDDIYEELWSHLKSGKYSELSIIDLDKKYDATGKVFVSDLVASASQPFVTVEEVNKNVVKYNVVRLEGDIDVTNLTNPVVELRIKMNLSVLDSAKVDFVYNTIVDLTDKDPNVLDATDTVVIDFLTDYKTARMKYLLKNGRDFDNALLQANDELAKALALKKDGEDYPQFEHYAPNELGLNEHFNSVLWIMALASQADVAKNVNKAYNDFRTIFAEEGNFKKPAKTLFDGREQSMYFVDYLALLINANEECGDLWCFDIMYEGYKNETAENFYKILQKGFKEVYRLDVEAATDFEDGYKIQKTSVDDGYFTYFKYDTKQEVWFPVVSSGYFFIETVAATAENGQCTSAKRGVIITLTSEKLDFSLKCNCDYGSCAWNLVDACEGREEGYTGFTREHGSEPWATYEFECVQDPRCDGSDEVCSLQEKRLPSSASSSSSYKSDEEILADALGACNEEIMKNDEKNFVKLNLKELMLSTMTGYGYYKCDHVFNDDGVDFYKWVSASDMDVEFNQACVESRKNEVRKVGETHYVCREYTPSSSTSSHSWSEEYDGEFMGDYRCLEESAGEIRSQEIDGNVVYRTCKKVEFEIYKWSDTEMADYCRDDVKINGKSKNNISETTQIVTDEDLGAKTFGEKCEFNETLYVRNSMGTSTNWMNVEQYIHWVYSDRSGVVSGNRYYIFMDGYTDHKIYFCTYDENEDFSCEETSVDNVRSNSSIAAQDQLNILANMTEYKKESENLFITEVLLPGATEKTKVAASAARENWHEYGLDDYCSINGHSVYLHYTDPDPSAVPSSSGSTTQDRICTADDGARYFKADANGIDGYWDNAIGEANHYSDKWYSVKEYCHTKSRDCYNENKPLPASASSSAFCEFPEYHDEKIVYACDRNSGEWVELLKYCDAHSEDVTYGDEGFSNDYLNETWSNLSCMHDSNDDPADVVAYCSLVGYYKLKDSDTWKSITCLTR